MEKKFVWVGLTILVVLAAAVEMIAYMKVNTTHYGGLVIDPPSPAANFTLIDPAGNLRLTYDQPNSPDDILADLQLLFLKS